MRSCFMAKRITMNTRQGRTFAEVYGEFITSQTAKGVSEITIRNYLHIPPRKNSLTGEARHPDR